MLLIEKIVFMEYNEGKELAEIMKFFFKKNRGFKMENIRNKDARPMMDLVAKKVFSNTEVTAQFIRDLLDLPVVSVKLLDGAQIHAKPYKDFLPFVTHVDVLAELDDKTQVIIEIQVAMQVDFIKRLWLYICEQVSQNLDKYKGVGLKGSKFLKKCI